MLTKKTMKEILNRTSHAITVDDFDLISELDELACEVAQVSKLHRRLLREPFELCGILFYPLTVAKSLWFNEKIIEWEVQPVHHEPFLFWLMSLPNEQGVFDQFCKRKQADRAIRRFSRRLTCSPDEIAETYQKCIGSSGGGSGRDVDYGGMIAVLLREYGGTPDQWLCEEPIPRISDLLRAYSERVNRENAANSDVANGAKQVVSQQTLEALHNLREKRNEIIKLWTEDDGK